MAYVYQKEQAQKLRKSGKSINEIADALHMNKSTVSMWCRDISLTNAQMQRLVDKQRVRGNVGLLKAAETKRKQRIHNIEIAKHAGVVDVGTINKRDLLLLGIGLYWGEGYKNINGEFGFTNSSPELIRAFIAWVTHCYDIKNEDLILRLSVNIRHKPNATGIMKYWSSITHVPLSQFTKTSYIRAKIQKNYSNKTTYRGTLRIKVRRGVALQRRVLGSIQKLSQQIH